MDLEPLFGDRAQLTDILDMKMKEKSDHGAILSDEMLKIEFHKERQLKRYMELHIAGNRNSVELLLERAQYHTISEYGKLTSPLPPPRPTLVQLSDFNWT